MATIGTPVRRREDYRFLTGSGTYTDDINRPGQLYAYHPAQPACACADHRASTPPRRSRRRASSPSTPARTWRPTASAGCPAAGRSIRRTARRWPSRRIRCWRSTGSAMSAIRSPSSSPRPSPRRRDAAELIKVDYAEEPAAIDPAAALQPGAPQVHRRGAGQSLLRLASRRSRRGRGRLRQGDAGRQARPHQQPARPQRDGAARRDRRVRPRDRRVHALHDEPEPARDPPVDGRLRAAHPRGASCGSSRPMSAAASARRSTTTPRRRSSPGPPAR